MFRSASEASEGEICEFVVKPTDPSIKLEVIKESFPELQTLPFEIGFAVESGLKSSPTLKKLLTKPLDLTDRLLMMFAFRLRASIELQRLEAVKLVRRKFVVGLNVACELQLESEKSTARGLQQLDSLLEELITECLVSQGETT